MKLLHSIHLNQLYIYINDSELNKQQKCFELVHQGCNFHYFDDVIVRKDRIRLTSQQNFQVSALNVCNYTERNITTNA